MILFKRVGESFRHIEDREWLLLFLETVGVLVGILLAFELQEWAANRAEAAKHRQLMERLFEESEVDVLVLRGWRSDLASIIEPEKTFAVALAKGQFPAANQWDPVNTVNMMPAVTAPSSVYQELTGAGGLSTIDRREVRLALAQFHGTLEWAQKQVDFFREARVTPLQPSDSRVRVAFDPTKDEPEVWTFDRPALCSDQAFKNRMASATRAHVVYANYQKDVEESAVETCAALAESMGKSCAPMDQPLTGHDAELAQRVVAAMRRPRPKR